MTDPLDLVHLRTLVEIADCGGFHRAAAALHLSQSTVSQHVRALEKVFREPLVHKSGRGTAFTPAGDALLVEARRILAGTVSAEHGIGVLKRDWIRRELGGDALELQRRIKQVLDPVGILNPGKVLP
jgi:molybdate transport repressor ModE-like protein